MYFDAAGYVNLCPYWIVQGIVGTPIDCILLLLFFTKILFINGWGKERKTLEYLHITLQEDGHITSWSDHVMIVEYREKIKNVGWLTGLKKDLRKAGEKREI